MSGVVEGWYVREGAKKRKRWHVFYAVQYPFHSAVAKQFGAGLPLGDHEIVVKHGLDGEERCFVVSNVLVTYARPV